MFWLRPWGGGQQRWLAARRASLVRAPTLRAASSSSSLLAAEPGPDQFCLTFSGNRMSESPPAAQITASTIHTMEGSHQPRS